MTRAIGRIPGASNLSVFWTRRASFFLLSIQAGKGKKLPLHEIMIIHENIAPTLTPKPLYNCTRVWSSHLIMYKVYTMCYKINGGRKYLTCTLSRLFSFGAGRRVCAGETFAKNRLFLMMTSLLQKFTFLPAEGFPPPDCDPRNFMLSLVMRPERYMVRAEPRVTQNWIHETIYFV